MSQATELSYCSNPEVTSQLADGTTRRRQLADELTFKLSTFLDKIFSKKQLFLFATFRVFTTWHYAMSLHILPTTTICASAIACSTTYN